MKKVLSAIIFCWLGVPAWAQQTYYVSVAYGDNNKCNGLS
jgi:hypothetical protein